MSSVGLGATLNVAKPKKGSTVAVFGLGAVGLAVNLLSSDADDLFDIALFWKYYCSITVFSEDIYVYIWFYGFMWLGCWRG